MNTPQGIAQDRGFSVGMLAASAHCLCVESVGSHPRALVQAVKRAGGHCKKVGGLVASALIQRSMAGSQWRRQINVRLNSAGCNVAHGMPAQRGRRQSAGHLIQRSAGVCASGRSGQAWFSLVLGNLGIVGSNPTTSTLQREAV